ncbi:hypothetical protein VTK26DRAFT_6107 [Humicola hyalothermophila]
MLAGQMALSACTSWDDDRGRCRPNTTHRCWLRLRHTVEMSQQNKRPRLDKPASIVEVLVRETTSRDAILRFMAVVCAWREAHDDLRGQLSLVNTYDESRRPEALDALRAACRENSHLFSFLEILTSVHLVRNVERRISVIAPKVINRILEHRGLEDTREPEVHTERVRWVWEMGSALWRNTLVCLRRNSLFCAACF